MKFFDLFKKKVTYDIEKIKQDLIAAEAACLRKQYPNEEDWRGPRNFAESMMCFGYASCLLDNYKTKLNEMSSEELIKLYKEL
jgi:hypothetical protein